MEMEIVFLQKKQLNLLLLKFAVLDIQQTQMDNVYTLNKHHLLLLINVQLDLLVMETEFAFKKGLLIQLLQLKNVDPDSQVMEMETVSQLIHKLPQLNILAKVDTKLMDSENAFYKQLEQHALKDISKILVASVFYLQLIVQMDKNQMEMVIAFLFQYIQYVQLDMKAMEMEIVYQLLLQQKIHNQFPIKQLKNLL